MKTNVLVKKYLLSAAVISSLTLSACVKETERIVEKQVPAQKEDSGPTHDATTEIIVSDKASADELALAAEQLVGPTTFMLAYKTASMALEKEPKNLKAQFYYTLLKGLEAFRGYGVRIRPMLTPEQLANHDSYMAKFPESPLKQFLMDSSKPAYTKVSDVQNALNEYFNGIVEFRKFLKDNQTAKMDIYLNPHVFEKQVQEEMRNSCTYQQTPDGFKFVCDHQNIARLKMNETDFIGLRQLSAGWIIYSFMNSYSLDGIEKLKNFDPTGSKSNQERTEFLAQQPGFGLLMKNHTLGLLKDLGADYSAAIKWATQYQSTLCPQGSHVSVQRPGYLFKNGVCIDPAAATELNKFVAVLDQALQGVTRMDLKDAQGQKVSMNVDAFAWSRSPIKDLRQVKPNQWNGCGHATSLADNTLGGVFVDNNFNMLMEQNCH